MSSERGATCEENTKKLLTCFLKTILFSMNFSCRRTDYKSAVMIKTLFDQLILSATERSAADCVSPGDIGFLLVRERRDVLQWSYESEVCCNDSAYMYAGGVQGYRGAAGARASNT